VSVGVGVGRPIPRSGEEFMVARYRGLVDDSIEANKGDVRGVW